MKLLSLMRRQRALLNCAPIRADQSVERSMRAAISRVDGSADFISQQNFDRAVAHVVRLIPIPAESAEWFSEKDLVPASRWTWKKMMRSLAAAKASLLLIGGQTTSPKQKYSHSSIYSRFGFGSCSPLNSLLSHSSIQPAVFTFSWQSIRPQIPAETARNITTTNLLDTYSRTVLPRSLENQRMSPNQSM